MQIQEKVRALLLALFALVCLAPHAQAQTATQKTATREPFGSSLLGYYPANKERDGRLRKVRVEVRDHPEYKVHGRRSYYATPR
ncbi:MAG TPA: hypothetical protein VN256_09315 [Pyrinomonadaceae bacterium]|nr:hypothetical protein [Pyrinomonadaceae bacterium]